MHVLCAGLTYSRSWLFTASLSLGVALAAGFDRALEGYLKDAIEALEYFSAQDPQAMQYLIIIKSLLATCMHHIEQKERSERLARIKAASDLFGLQPSLLRRDQGAQAAVRPDNQAHSAMPSPSVDPDPSILQTGFATPDWEDFDLAAFGDLSSATNQDIFGTLNLFPMFDNS